MTTSTQMEQVRNPKAMAFVLMFGAFIGLFSETALNMALTNIMEDFSILTATAQWLTTGYLLTLGILVPVSVLLIQWFTTKQLVVSSLIFSIIKIHFSSISTKLYFVIDWSFDSSNWYRYFITFNDECHFIDFPNS